jgi:catalase (peroxidase I)
MPRTTEEILAHADELGRRFEEHEPGDVKDARALRDIAAAFARFARSERDLVAAVSVARAEGHTWAAIGAMLGTSGEAARQRYGDHGRSRQHGRGVGTKAS